MRRYDCRRIKKHRSYTVAEVEKLLDVHPHTVRRWIADEFSAFDPANPLSKVPPSGRNTLPLLTTAKHIVPMDVRDVGHYDNPLEAAVRLAQEQGGDALALRGIEDLGGPQTQYVFWDPALLRSRFAQFDPARTGENDLLASRIVGYNPPSKPQRAFELDYPADYRFGEYADDTGRLTRTIDGDRIRPGTTVVGRSLVRGSDEGLREPAELARLAEAFTGSPFKVAPLRGKAGAYDKRPITRGEFEALRPHEQAAHSGFVPSITLKRRLNPAEADIVLAHESGHAMNDLAGDVVSYSTTKTGKRIPFRDISFPPDAQSQLGTIYRDLNEGKLPAEFGYPTGEVPSELNAEAIRAYLTDPNYMKSTAPQIAERIRKSWNTGPYADLLQSNSLAGLGLLGGGAALSLPMLSDRQQ